MRLIKWLVDWWQRDNREFVQFAEEMERLEEEYQSEIEPLSTQEAKLRAEQLLADPSRFRCTLAVGSTNSALDQLAPLVREFFRRYDEVLQMPGDLVLWGTELNPSSVDATMRVIGSSGEEHTHLAVRPSEETVYTLDEEVPDKEHKRPSSRFPSVYHCILYYDHYQAVLDSP